MGGRGGAKRSPRASALCPPQPPHHAPARACTHTHTHCTTHLHSVKAVNAQVIGKVRRGGHLCGVHLCRVFQERQDAVRHLLAVKEGLAGGVWAGVMGCVAGARVGCGGVGRENGKGREPAGPAGGPPRQGTAQPTNGLRPGSRAAGGLARSTTAHPARMGRRGACPQPAPPPARPAAARPLSQEKNASVLT